VWGNSSIPLQGYEKGNDGKVKKMGRNVQEKWEGCKDMKGIKEWKNRGERTVLV
jgi:hypothetical protein